MAGGFRKRTSLDSPHPGVPDSTPTSPKASLADSKFRHAGGSACPITGAATKSSSTIAATTVPARPDRPAGSECML